MHRLLAYGVFGLLAVGLALSARTTFGQSGGTVTATVQVQAAACITIAPNSFTYTAAGLSSTSSPTTTLPSSAKPVVTNCSSSAENFLAKGGSATGSGVTWTLGSSHGDCSAPTLNQYRHELKPGTGSFFSLSETDQVWESAVSATNSRTVDTRLTMPCNGSDGVGLTMSIPIILTAVVP
jgi:hypothetical protein